MNQNEIQAKLNHKAKAISEEFNGAPVVIIVAGSKGAGIPACTTGWSQIVEEREGRLRDLLGILETAKQIESYRHFQ